MRIGKLSGGEGRDGAQLEGGKQTEGGREKGGVVWSNYQRNTRKPGGVRPWHELHT